MTEEIVAKYMQELDDDKIQNIENIFLEVTQIIAKNSDDYAVYILRGRLYIRKIQHQEAYDDFSKSISINPKNYDGYFFRAHVLQLMKKTRDAIQDLNRAIEINNDNDKSRAYFERGQLYYEMNQYQNALKDYTKAIELDPKYANAYFNRGIAFYDQNKLDDAITDYPKAIELNPNYSEAYNNRGNVFKRQNKLDDGIKDYTKAIELDPKYAAAFNSRGNAFKNQKKLDDSINDYTKAIELEPNNPLILSNIGEYYISQNQFEKAQQYIIQAQDVLDSTEQQQLMKQYKLSFAQIKLIQQTLFLLSQISIRLKKIEIKMEQHQKQNTFTDKVEKQFLEIQENFKELLNEDSSNDKVSIQQLENYLKLLSEEVSEIEKNFNQSMEKIRIEREFIYLQDYKNIYKRFYFLSFCPRILTYLEACRLVDTGFFQVNYNKAIETNSEKLIEKINKEAQFFAPQLGGIPLVGSVLEILFQLFDFGVKQQKEKKFNDKIKNIMAVIKFKGETQSEIEKQFQLATFESMNNITEEDLNINDLEYYDQVQEIIQIEQTQNKDAQNYYWQLGVYHCIIVLKFIDREKVNNYLLITIQIQEILFYKV